MKNTKGERKEERAKKSEMNVEKDGL